MKSAISRDPLKARELQLLERLPDQQVNQGRRCNGGDVATAVEKMRERYHLAGSNRSAGARQLMAQVLRHGRRRRDQPGTRRMEKTIERQPRFAGRRRSGNQERIGQINTINRSNKPAYCLAPVSCGARSFIIFSNFSRCSGFRICMMRVLPVERRSSSCSCRLS